MPDFSVPTLPMRNATETRRFYEKLGFVGAHELAPPDSFLFMMCTGIQLQFFEAPFIDGTLRDHTCYFHVDDIEGTYEAFAKAGVDRLMSIEQKRLGVPEFVLNDVDDNMLRVGCPRLSH